MLIGKLNPYGGSVVDQTARNSINQLSVKKADKSEVTAVNSRVDNIIAHNDDTDGNSELIDLHLGADGTEYSSAGTAVRSQIGHLKILHDRTEGQINLFDKEAFTPDCEYHIDTRQIIPNSKGYGLSELIPVTAGDVLFYSKDGTEFKVTFTYGFDISGNYVDGSRATTATSYIVPQGAVFIRVCIKTENIDKFQIEYNGVSDYKPFTNMGQIVGSLKNIDSRVSELEDIVNPQPTTSPLAVIEKYPSFISCFMNVGCIGDSLASGVAVSKNAAGEIKVDSENRYQYSWGQYLARMTGNQYYNWSKGGLRTDTWLTSDYAEACYDGEHLCQAYIIGLGQNDNNHSKGADLGTASDIDIADYHNNNNTFYGRYAKIIQKIQEITPKAKIFVITDPNDSVNANGYNTAIRDIAEMFNNVYLIDMRRYMNTAPCAALLQSQMRYGHFNAVGYFLIAKMMMTYIDYIIEHNSDDFREIENIGTDFHWY